MSLSLPNYNVSSMRGCMSPNSRPDKFESNFQRVCLGEKTFEDSRHLINRLLSYETRSSRFGEPLPPRTFICCRNFVSMAFGIGFEHFSIECKINLVLDFWIGLAACTLGTIPQLHGDGFVLCYRSCQMLNEGYSYGNTYRTVSVHSRYIPILSPITINIIIFM